MITKEALAIAHDPLSYTKLSVGKKCPFRFRKQYIERIRPIDEVDQTSANIGTVVHNVIEQALIKSNKNELDTSSLPHEIFLLMKSVCEDKKLTEKEIFSVIGFQDSLERSVKRVLDFKSRHGIYFVEKELAFDAEFSPVSFYDKKAFFRGKLDLVLVSPEGNVAILDHKTGYKTLKGYEDQLQTYEILATFSLLGELKEQHGICVNRIQTGLNFLADDSIEWAKPKTTDMIRMESKEWLISLINRVAKDSEEGKPSRGRHCRWCGYRSLCGSKVGLRKKKEVLGVSEVNGVLEVLL